MLLVVGRLDRRKLGCSRIAGVAAAGQGGPGSLLTFLDDDGLVGLLLLLAHLVGLGVVLVVARDFLGTDRQVGLGRDVDLVDLLENPSQRQLPVGELQLGIGRVQGLHGAAADDDAFTIGEDEQKIHIQCAHILDGTDGDLLQELGGFGKLEDGSSHGGFPLLYILIFAMDGLQAGLMSWPCQPGSTVPGLTVTWNTL
ncbi:hypothetical protein FYB76_10340 [Herbaspirillum sp. CAH-3]|nr:hypothetical protein [Herbaspirillum sp. CAH-3]